MFKIIFSNLLISILLLNTTFAGELIIKGLERLNQIDLQALTTIDLSQKNFNDNEINLLIKELYQSDQIINISSLIENENYLVTISESPVIENIYINGNIEIEDEFFETILNSKKNYFLNKKSISDDIKLIKDIYSNKGFDSTIVTASSEKFSTTKVNLIYQINEGNKFDINSIKFYGNNTFNSKYLSSIINSNENKFYNIFSSGSSINQSIFDNDLKLLINFYKNKGFNNIDISYSLRKNFFNSYSLIFYINEGNRLKLSSIDFDISDDILNIKEFNSLKNIFTNKILSDDSFYDYYLIDNFINDSNDIIFNKNLNREFFYDFSIEENLYLIRIYDKPIEPKIINSIDIHGNSITKTDVLISKLSIEPGDNYSIGKVKNSADFLESLKYINSVSYNTTNIENKTNIIFEIDENKKTGNVLVGGSYTGDIGFGLVFSINDYNAFGSGNEIEFESSLNPEVALFDIQYKQYPYSNPAISNIYRIQNKETDLTSSFGYKLDQKGLGYSLNFKQTNDIHISIGAEYQNSRGHSAANSSDLSITDNIGTFDDTEFNFSISHDKTNNNLYPNDGYYNSLNLKYSPDLLSNNNYVIASYKGDIYYKIENSENYYFISNRYGYAASTDGRLKTRNSFSLGGSNFKGFDYRGIGKKTSNNRYLGGNQYFTSTIGYGSTFLFDNKDDIFLKLFYTAGSLWDSDYADQDFKLRSSLGASFDILTVVGPITFSYAIPIHKESDDSLRRFNFSIGTAF